MSKFFTKPPVIDRDEMIKEHLSKHKSEFTKEKDIKIFIGSWNVNGQTVNEDLSPWLGDYPEESSKPADIVALGFQELDLRTEAYIFYESHKEAEWLTACDKCLRKVVNHYNKYYGKKWGNISQNIQNYYISPKKYSQNINKQKLPKETQSSLKHVSSSSLLDTSDQPEKSDKILSRMKEKYSSHDQGTTHHPPSDIGLEALNLASDDSILSHSRYSTPRASLINDNIDMSSAGQLVTNLTRKLENFSDNDDGKMANSHTKTHPNALRKTSLHPALEIKDTEIEEITPFSPYVKLHLVRLVGIMLVVFVKKDLLRHISDIGSETIGTGLLGKMGNKGGVAIRFTLYGTPLCFVNSHFAAHPDELERRNQDYNDIANKIQFNQFGGISILDHDYLFWFGDLNYRIDIDNQSHAKEQILNNQIDTLMKFDQLSRQKEFGRIFDGFEEGPIDFPPTYKYDPGTDHYDTSEKARVPSWCDRILWRSLNPDKIILIRYRSHPKLRLSDHKPVSALFNLKLNITDQSRFKQVYEHAMKNIDKIENEYLPHAELDTLEVNFNKTHFMEKKTKHVTLTNVGQVPLQFEFTPKFGTKVLCKSWLSISPHKYAESNFIYPGEECPIAITCCVTKTQAPLLNSGADSFDDILILHLENGKDFFISVIGTYVKSVFGASLEEMVEKGALPYHSAVEKPLIDLFDDELSQHAVNDPTAQTDIPTNLILQNHKKDAIKYIESKNYLSFSLLDLNAHVPCEIWIMVAQILERGIKEPDLFQKPGPIEEITVIRDSLDFGTSLIKECDVHSICDALIIFLEALREPVFPVKFYENLVSTVLHVDEEVDETNLEGQEIKDHHNHHSTHKFHASTNNAKQHPNNITSLPIPPARRRVRKNINENFPHIGEIMDKMPLVHRDTLKFLVAFLQCLLDYSSQNGVSYELLASIFGRILIRPSAKLVDITGSSKDNSHTVKDMLTNELSLHQQYLLDKKRKAFLCNILQNF